MDHPVSPAEIFVCDRFRFDRRVGGLFQLDGGAPVAIGSRALDLLGVLVERPGDLVSKDEIMGAVWPRTVVEDGNLTVQISTLRRVLDKGHSEGSCIQTIPGRGYRFVGQVTRYEPGRPPSTAPPRSDHADTDVAWREESLPINRGPPVGALNGLRRRLVIGLFLGMAICLTAVAVSVFWTLLECGFH